ncbi:hypothetical protein EON64_15680 [archaeon]|nr:MAG: hypothetical protein EON64_15680 [archaeon]
MCVIAWLAYRGKVYDVSNWEEHPGAVHFVSSYLLKPFLPNFAVF